MKLSKIIDIFIFLGKHELGKRPIAHAKESITQKLNLYTF